MAALRNVAILLAIFLAATVAFAQQGQRRVFTNDDVQRSSPAAAAPVPNQTKPSSELPAQPAISGQSLLSTADSVFEEMSHLTGLPIKAPLKKRIVNRQEIRHLLEDTLRTEYTPQMIKEQEAALIAFGVVPTDFDLAKFMLGFYTEQAAGIYDAHSKTMLLADWVAPEVQEMVLRHELTHALQDQNFDLDKFLRVELANDDATAARQAVAEGYATAAMIQQVLGPLDLSSLPALAPLIELATQMQPTEFPEFQKAPFFLRFQAMFPYTQGISFMQQGLAQGGWARLNKIFLKPPATTREVFQPELYFTGNAASNQTTMTLPHPKPLSSASEMHFITENIMGELGYYALIGQLISEGEAESAARDLVADRYLIYENSAAHRYALVAATRWTSPEAAQNFCRRYQTIITKKSVELTPDRRSTPDQFIGSAKAGAVLLLRKSNECLWAEGMPTAQTDAMLDYLKSVE